ncbi:helix-turn-helix transcriptional regulator [Kaarinaea lacus]
MRKADRLFQIVQILRSRRTVTTARYLADRLEVTERTIYRDMQDLMLSGVPIMGEAGIGYALPKAFDLPPLMFTDEELTAITLGARLVASWSDEALADAAKQALHKIQAVVPQRLQERLDKENLFSPMRQIDPAVAVNMAKARAAADNNRKLSVEYVAAGGEPSSRTVWPLGLFFWGSIWTLGAWCELRQAFRNFRLDRVTCLTVLDEMFPSIPGRTIQDFIEEARRGF